MEDEVAHEQAQHLAHVFESFLLVSGQLLDIDLLTDGLEHFSRLNHSIPSSLLLSILIVAPIPLRLIDWTSKFNGWRGRIIRATSLYHFNYLMILFLLILGWLQVRLTLYHLLLT